MTVDAWIAALCDRLDVPIDDVDVSGILDLAKDAAHNVERPAAPLTTFIAGYAAAVNGGGAAEVEAALTAAADLATQWPQNQGVIGAAPEATPPLDNAEPNASDS